MRKKAGNHRTDGSCCGCLRYSRGPYQFLDRPAMRRFSVRWFEDVPLTRERKPRKKTPSGIVPARRMARSRVTATRGKASAAWEPMQHGSIEVPAARRNEAGSWKVRRPSSLGEPRAVYGARPARVKREWTSRWPPWAMKYTYGLVPQGR